MKKYVISINDGLYYDSKNVFSRDELDEVFKEWSRGSKMVDVDGDVVSVDDLIDYGSVVEIYNKNMVERGDDYVSVGVYELDE